METGELNFDALVFGAIRVLLKRAGGSVVIDFSEYVESCTNKELCICLEKVSDGSAFPKMHVYLKEEVNDSP